MSDDDGLNAEIVQLIYDAALDEKLWPQVVKGVGEATGGFGGALTLWDIQKRSPPHSYNQGFPPDFWADYTNNLIHLDPLVPAFVARPKIEIYTGEMLIGADGERDKLRSHIRVRAGQGYAYGARIFADSGIESTLILARSRTQGTAGQHDLERLQRYLPHLRRSILLARKIGEKASMSALDALSSGIHIIDEDGRVSFVNKAMSAIAAEQDGLTLTRTGLAIADAGQDTTYRRLTAAMLQNMYSTAQPPRAALPVTRPSGKRSYSVLVCPLPHSSNVFPDARRRILVCVSDPSQAMHLNADFLHALFGLSAAEAKLAMNLIQFGSLKHAATASGLTEGSARQYIKRISFKTETRGQVELVALLMSSARL